MLLDRPTGTLPWHERPDLPGRRRRPKHASSGRSWEKTSAPCAFRVGLAIRKVRPLTEARTGKKENSNETSSITRRGQAAKESVMFARIFNLLGSKSRRGHRSTG